MSPPSSISGSSGPRPDSPVPAASATPAASSRKPLSSLVVGVLGGIASGKSAVARMLAGPDGVVIDADEIARTVLDSAAVRFELLAAFGGGVFGRDGKPDREALARRVFRSPEARTKLEAFTHPPIRARIRAALQAAVAAGVPRVVLDVPLLLENESGHGLAAECDEIVFVEAREDLRDARAVRSRGWRPGEVARREAVQMPLAQKRARAGKVVLNQGTLAELEKTVAEIAAGLEPRGPNESRRGERPVDENVKPG